MQDYLIYSVEDDLEISNLINIALTKFGFPVKSFEDGESFLREFENKKPNLILLDIMLPGIQGDEILRLIRSKHENNNIPIIVLSAKAMIDDKVAGLNDGADDYIGKPFSVKELISRINVRYRKHLASRFMIKIGPFTLDQEHEILYKYNSEVELTKNEFKLLKYLFLKHGNVVTREELFQEVWGHDVKSDSRTIDMHIKSLREKIGDIDKTFIHSIYGAGYKID